MDISKIKIGSKTYDLKDTASRTKLAGIESGAQAHKAPTSSEITTALGYTPYNATNPNGYTSNAGTVTGVKVGSSGSTISPSSGVVTIPAYESGAQVHKAPTTAEVKSALGTGSGTSKYLREDGTWATPPDNNTTYSAATTSAAGLMSAADKTKLDGIATGATANAGTITGIKMNGASKGTSGVVDLGTVITAHQDISGKVNTSTTVNGHALTGNISVTKSDVGLGNVTNDSQVKRSEMGAASGVATLDSSGKVPSSQLPSYVDDVIEAYYKAADGKFYTTLSSGTYSGAITGETGKIYVDLSTSRTYRWGGSAYTEIKASPGTLDDITDGSTYVRMTSTERTKLSGIATGATANTGTITKVGNTSSGAVTVSSSNNTASFGNAVTVGSVGGVDLKFTMPGNPNTNTWRPIQVGGTDKLTDSSTKINFAGSGATSVSYSNGTVTISSTDNNTVTSINGKTGAIAAADIAAVLTAAGHKLTDTDTNTHYTAVPVAGGQTATSNATSATTDPYINIIENSAKSGGIQIKGSGATSVSAVNGVITISSTDTNTQAVSSVVGQTGAVTAAQIGTALTNAGYKLTDTNTTYNFSGTAFTSNNSTGQDANNVAYNAHTYYSSNGPATSLGASTNDGALYSQAYSTSWVGQIAQDYRNGGLYVRGKNNGTWQSWYKVWDSRNLTNLNQLSNGPGYITGITKAMVTTALGYTPPTTDTNTVTSINGKTGAIAAADIATVLTGAGYKLTDTDTNTWKAATTSQEGYVPTLALSGTSSGAKKDTINTQASDYVLTYTSGTETAPVWRKLPANAYANSTYTVNNGTFTVKGAGTAVSSTSANASGNTAVDFVAGSNVTITPDATNGKITIASTDTNTWRPVGTGATDAAAGNHTHTASLASDTGTSAITLAHGGKYKLTAGGQSVIFTMPSDNNTTYSAGTGLSLSSNTFSLATSGVTAGTYKRVTVDAYGRVTAGDQTDADSDTKNTAGTTNNTGKKMFLVGAESLAANPVTYSNSNCYIGTDNCLYSGGSKVLTSYTNTTYAAGTGVTISGTNNAINVTYGTAANTACQGNDSRLSNSRPASDVYSWAKAANKPSYAYSEIGYTVSATSSAGGTLSLAGTTPLHVVTLTGNVSALTLSANPAEGHSCHVIFTAAAEYTVAIAHDSTSRVCPGAEDLSLTVPAGGYVEIDFLTANSKVYVRGV